jgi:prepilin-type N-terminal cleavage/methylation domain-containing protein
VRKKKFLKNRFKKNCSGFTLVELLIVIAIIGLLGSIVFVSLRESKAKSRDGKRAADVISIAQALNLYQNNNQKYPCSVSDTPCASGETAITGVDNLSVKLKAENVISTAPLDPLNTGNYRYFYNSDGKTYTLRYCQETTINSRLSQDCNNIISP